jgi:hypothetical protein
MRKSKKNVGSGFAWADAHFLVWPHHGLIDTKAKCRHLSVTQGEQEDSSSYARIKRPSFRENKPNTVSINSGTTV